jgi:hypothetical protein
MIWSTIAYTVDKGKKSRALEEKYVNSGPDSGVYIKKEPFFYTTICCFFLN